MTQEELKKIAEESWEGCDSCTETDKQMYINGFVKAALSGVTRIKSTRAYQGRNQGNYRNQFCWQA